ncbi:MAG: YbbR-like domain-containing protein [Bacteroidales bacterium]
MKVNLLKLGIFFKNLKASNYKKDLGVFLIFVIISAIFWFFNELEDDYVTRLQYPVEYTHLPENKIVVGALPSSLELKVRGQGFQLLEYKLVRNLNPLMLEVGSYNLKSQDHPESLMYYIPTESIQSDISQQLNSKIEIIDILPDTLFFEFTDQISRKLPVEANVEYSFGQQMMLKGNVTVKPDSIEVLGPRSVLDTVDKVMTKYREFDDLTSTVELTVDLENIHEQVEYQHNHVKLRIPVEQYTEGSLKKEIAVRNRPDSVVVRIFPSSVNITYLVGLSNYEEVIPELFKVYVDYEGVRNNNEQLKVFVEKAPDYLKSYSYTPQRVDFILEKKND